MPYFAQEPLSYLTLPTIKHAYKAFSIKINFRPDNVDGKEMQPYICFPVKCNSLSIYTFLLLYLAVR
ncbi:Basement membrane-specific heparan sulfate proteoglycan core protein [Liparis tanakae]|uniref:Basement membrane-specific heparan sulfate proteoglycan core protein n=1 Tax=Liparis tanakae TaxID=230148 RepID=A0A4Z2E0D6_9TELE|nr:Basement membrane-specific heparan sulfate proteoglycan core protein [Liparis tanakae]